VEEHPNGKDCAGPRPVNYPPASVVLALFVVLSVFGNAVYVLVFYLN
jgi:hypothetical protein